MRVFGNGMPVSAKLSDKQPGQIPPPVFGGPIIPITTPTKFSGPIIPATTPPRFGKRDEPKKPPRELSMTEFHVANGLGMATSLATGFATGEPLLGILGMFVAPIPFLLAYVGGKRFTRDPIKMPNIRFNPGISWAGKHHGLFPDKPKKK